MADASSLQGMDAGCFGQVAEAPVEAIIASAEEKSKVQTPDGGKDAVFTVVKGRMVKGEKKAENRKMKQILLSARKCQEGLYFFHAKRYNCFV